jgi:hypothetical protein
VPALYRFDRQGRSLGTLIALPLIWLALFAAWFFLKASPIIIGLVALCTLPALWDVIKNPSAGLTLGDGSLNWHSASRTAKASLSEIDHIRLDTRLDFSVRATLILKTGRKIRIPFEATPPHQTFETALNAHAIRTERHHFSLRQ